MDKETLAALKGSIKKWEDIRDGKEADEGPDNCPLCELFFKRRCAGCPIADEVEEPTCHGTPYPLFNHCGNRECEGTKMAKCPECIEVAQKEVDFLKGLLP